MSCVLPINGYPSYSIRRIPAGSTQAVSGLLTPGRKSAIRRSEDAFVDDLFAHVVPLGAPLLRAHFPRAYLDVNREPYELDPEDVRRQVALLCQCPLDPGCRRTGHRCPHRQRKPRDLRHRLPVEEALNRIEEIYKPYHSTLRRLLAQTHVTFGYAVLIDCHSMPSSVKCQTTDVRPDFILGDRYGTSCNSDLTEYACSILRGMGYSVSRNKPYAGGFITEHYGRPASGLHALQIEINRGLYMNEATQERSPGFDDLFHNLKQFAQELIAMPDAALPADSIAAE